MPDKDTILNQLKTIPFPGFTRDIVSFGIVKNIAIEDKGVKVALAITTSNSEAPLKIKAEVERVLQSMEGIDSVEVGISVQQPSQAKKQLSSKQPAQNGLAKVEKIIAISSGKGGVGKSTFTSNLAVAISHELNARGDKRGVGVMDCDIYGPSIPLMLGVKDRPEMQGDKIIPEENFDMKIMSMGLLIDPDQPVLWRGPMVASAISQFISNVDWGELAIVITDLPPGTGDAQLTLTQTLPLDGTVVVTTPQAAAVNVAIRGAKLFDKVNVPILGVAENMSYLENPQNGEKSYIFGQGGGEAAAKELDCKFLGAIPLDEDIRIGSDKGEPIVLTNPESTASKAFVEIAKQIVNTLF